MLIRIAVIVSGSLNEETFSELMKDVLKIYVTGTTYRCMEWIKNKQDVPYIALAVILKESVPALLKPNLK